MSILRREERRHQKWLISLGRVLVSEFLVSCFLGFRVPLDLKNPGKTSPNSREVGQRLDVLYFWLCGNELRVVVDCGERDREREAEEIDLLMGFSNRGEGCGIPEAILCEGLCK